MTSDIIYFHFYNILKIFTKYQLYEWQDWKRNVENKKTTPIHTLTFIYFVLLIFVLHFVYYWFIPSEFYNKIERSLVERNVTSDVLRNFRVPTDGYYFFVFSSENEIQPNYIRVQFDLLKTVYNTSNSVHQCQNSTTECSLPIRFFSNERTIFELPFSGNDSQWNEEYVVISTCEPRTIIYIVCTMTVPLLILIFAFH